MQPICPDNTLDNTQTRLRGINKYASFVPCAAHSLSLVGMCMLIIYFKICKYFHDTLNKDGVFVILNHPIFEKSRHSTKNTKTNVLINLQRIIPKK
jgi:hypothetical protein